MTLTVSELDEVSAEVDRRQLDRIGQLIERDIESGACDGVALRVSVRGRQLLDVRSGYADRQAGKELSADTAMCLLSVSKQFGSVLTLMFIERGLLRLHTPVSDVIPEFGRLGKETTSVHHLLTQTSGLAPDIPMPTLPIEAWQSNSAMVQHICLQKPLAAPGTRVSYQGFFGHALLAEMLERVDPEGRSYVDIVAQELLDPLGMVDTAMGLTREDLIDRFAPMVARFDQVDMFDPDSITDSIDLLRAGVVVPGAGYVSTIADLHRFSGALVNGTSADGARILSRASLDYASRNQTGEMPNDILAFTAGLNLLPWPANIGTGFFVRGSGSTIGPVGNLAGPRTLAGLGSGSTSFVVDPDRELNLSFMSVGVMADSDHFARIGRITDMVIAAL